MADQDADDVRCVCGHTNAQHATVHYEPKPHCHCSMCPCKEERYQPRPVETELMRLARLMSEEYARLRGLHIDGSECATGTEDEGGRSGS